MNITAPLFITSAIPYVNAEPHLGHALELVQSDAIARHQRQQGRDVRFTSGTDDNSLKNVRAAANARCTPHELVARNGAEFRRLAQTLEVQHDDFIHTASDARHAPAVRALWERCARNGDLYRKKYRGLYCVGCEHFLRESEISDGSCPLHPAALEAIEEENWFFRLSRYAPQITAAIESERLRILPRERKNEVCQFIASGLSDFSVSRSRARAEGWGIPVPGDDSQLVYVWFDALANYLSVLGFPDRDALTHYWQGEGERWHLIGKDIVRFHAVYWPGILASAGLNLPSVILVHGLIGARGKKLSKSLGNSVDPFRLVARYGVDAVRYYLLAHLHTTKDGDFREELLATAYDAELVGKLGNLLQRVTALYERTPVALDGVEPDQELCGAITATRSDVQRKVREFALHEALRAIFELVNAANRYADRHAPWQLAKQYHDASELDSRERARLAFQRCLASLVHALRAAAALLEPFLPDTARRIQQRLRPRPWLGPALFPQRTP